MITGRNEPSSKQCSVKQLSVLVFALLAPLTLLADPLGSKGIGYVLVVFALMFVGGVVTFLYFLLLALLKKEVIRRSLAMAVLLPLLLILLFAIEHIYILRLGSHPLDRFYFSSQNSFLFNAAFLVLPLGAAVAAVRMIWYLILRLIRRDNDK